jgi:hypothetical protein
LGHEGIEWIAAHDDVGDICCVFLRYPDVWMEDREFMEVGRNTTDTILVSLAYHQIIYMAFGSFGSSPRKARGSRGTLLVLKG